MHDLKFSLGWREPTTKKGGEGGEWLLNARIGAGGTIRMVHRIAQKGDNKNWFPNAKVYVASAGFCYLEKGWEEWEREVYNIMEN